MPVTTQALTNMRGGHSAAEPSAGFITFGGYDF
jgi:hypothetical protein